MTPETETMAAAPLDETWNYRIPRSLADLIPLFENRVACHRMWAEWLGQDTDETRRYGEHGLGHAKNHWDYVKQYSAAKQLVEDHERALIATAVAVKGLEWQRDWSGSNDDIPSWRGKNPLGLHVSVCFAGRLFNGMKIERHDDAPIDALEAAKAAAQAEYEAHIRSAIAPATQLVPGAMVEALRFYANEKNWTAGRWPDDLDELVEGLICIDWQHEEGGSIPFADCGDRARAAIAAAPATQAVPAVARAHITTADSAPYPDIDLEVLDGAFLRPEMSPVLLYASPVRVAALGTHPVPVAVTDSMVHAYKHSFGEYMDKSALGHITPPTPDVGFHATKYALGVALAPATQAAPMVEVPREPTEAMLNAVSGMSVSGPYLGSNEARDIWDVMLAAPR